MNDYPNKRDCEHGHKRGKCELCDRDEEIAELQRELSDAKSEVEKIANEALQMVIHARNVFQAGERARWLEAVKQEDAEYLPRKSNAKYGPAYVNSVISATKRNIIKRAANSGEVKP